VWRCSGSKDLKGSNAGGQRNYPLLPPPRQAALDRWHPPTCTANCVSCNRGRSGHTLQYCTHRLPISLVGALPSGAMRQGSKLRVHLGNKREMAAGTGLQQRWMQMRAYPLSVT